jgi:hypothetical protein
MSGERYDDIIKGVNQSGLATVWRNQAGTVRVRRGWMHCGPKGSPDVVGFTRRGRFVGFEVKTVDGKTDKELAALQAVWSDKIREAGGVCAEVVTPQDAVGVLIREDWK